MMECNLRLLQLQELDLLLQFQQVCEENDFSYYLTGGTLLGAVRHKGFIPWDDDIDIVMPRKDYDRLLKLYEQGFFPEGYWLQNCRSDGQYPHYFSKWREISLSDETLDQTQVYIDIFPLDPCPDWDCLAILYFKGFELINMALLSQMEESFSCGYRKWYMRFLWNLLRKLSGKSLFRLREALRKGFGIAASGKKVCNVGGRYGFPQEVCDWAWFSETSELEFEGKLFPVPSGWQQLLTRLYGDYMVLPDETERHGH